MNDAVLATTKTMRTLADGGMTVTLDIAPQHMEAAFRLFGKSGTNVGVAALTGDAARDATRAAASALSEPPIKQSQREATQQEVRRSFIQLSRVAQAGIRCNEPQFWQYLEAHLGLGRGFVSDKDEAARHVRQMLDITSRAHLDSDPAAAKGWDTLEGEYFAYLHGRH